MAKEKAQPASGSPSDDGGYYRAWPDKSCRYWWMQLRWTPRSKIVVLLVELIEHDGVEYVKPFQDRNYYPRSFAEDWSAKFKPCFSTPEFSASEEKDRVRSFADELRNWWRFSEGQQPNSGYHDREDFIDKKLPELLSR